MEDTTRTDDTAGLIFVPDGPGKPRRRRQRPLPVLTYTKAEQAGEPPKPPAPQQSPAAKPESAPKFTLEEAFDYDQSEYKTDAVKGVLAVAYLLESVSSLGNDEIDGRIAQGLAITLRYYAKNMNSYLAPAEDVKDLEYRLEQLKAESERR